jgi:hypothetical protein
VILAAHACARLELDSAALARLHDLPPREVSSSPSACTQSARDLVFGRQADGGKGATTASGLAAAFQ